MKRDDFPKTTIIRPEQLYLRYLLPLVLICLLTACTHRISIAPQFTDIYKPIFYPIKVAYVISDTEFDQEVISAAGSDEIKYHPYKALDVSLSSALSQMFESVVRIGNLSEITDKSKILIISVPSIMTTSRTPRNMSL